MAGDRRGGGGAAGPPGGRQELHPALGHAAAAAGAAAHGRLVDESGLAGLEMEATVTLHFAKGC